MKKLSVGRIAALFVSLLLVAIGSAASAVAQSVTTIAGPTGAVQNTLCLNPDSLCASGLDASQLQVHFVQGVILDPVSGDLMIGDRGNAKRMYRVDKNTNVISVYASEHLSTNPTIFLNFGGFEGQFVDVIVSGGQVYGMSSNYVLLFDTIADTASVVAGTGGFGNTGDGGPATAATLQANMMCRDATSGDIYLPGSFGIIRKIDGATGIISTVSGTPSTYGYTDGPAASALWSITVNGCAIDSQGDVYIADTNNNVVRKLDVLMNTVSTVVGSGNSGPFDPTDEPALVKDQSLPI